METTRTQPPAAAPDVGLTVGAAGLTVAWPDGGTSRYPWFWLRDHSHDPATLHAETLQRQIDTAALPAAIAGRGATRQGDCIEITWSDGSAAARLPLAFLAAHRQPATASLASGVARRTWDAASLPAAGPRVPYAEIMAGDDGLRAWLEQIETWGFCIAAGTPADPQATEALIRRVGYIRETLFGGFWDFTADRAKADTAYTNLELRPHTDGTYSHDAPGLQMLHCLAFAGSGGQSTVIDGLKIAERLRDEAPQHYATLSLVAVPGQYIGDGMHLRAARPVFRHDHQGRLAQVSFNNYDRAPFLLPDGEMAAFYAALRAFEALANDPAMQWIHRLAPGEALLFDNWRVLHGRKAYDGTRRLCGAYLNHEDYESRLRMLRSG